MPVPITGRHVIRHLAIFLRLNLEQPYNRFQFRRRQLDIVLLQLCQADLFKFDICLDGQQFLVLLHKAGQLLFVLRVDLYPPSGPLSPAS